ncbi:gag-asp_proteas domain-containing protein, partial [Cephalotus follicularis]
ERFKDLLLECPHHGLNTWHLCQIIYEGIDYQTKQLVESMCPDGITSYTDENDAWNFLLDLGERTREWESAQASERALPNKGYVIEGVVALEAQLDSCLKRIESLLRGSTQVNQIDQNTPMCSWCHGTEYHPADQTENVSEQMEKSLAQEDFQEPLADPSVQPMQLNAHDDLRKEEKDEKKKKPIEEPKCSFDPPAPFPKRLQNTKAPAMEKIIETFKQVQINIPLLEAIEQVPSYAKVLKDLCTKKRILQTPKKAFLTANISALFSQPTMQKYKDPGYPTIACVIGNMKIEHALLDLGASVNLLPSSVYERLGLGELRPTTMTLQSRD